MKILDLLKSKKMGYGPAHDKINCRSYKSLDVDRYYNYAQIGSPACLHHCVYKEKNSEEELFIFCSNFLEGIN